MNHTLNIRTKAFLRARIIQAMPAIAEAQRTSSACDFHLVVELNALRTLVVQEMAAVDDLLEAALPRLELRTMEGFNVTPERALQLQDALIFILDFGTGRHAATG